MAPIPTANPIARLPLNISSIRAIDSSFKRSGRAHPLHVGKYGEFSTARTSPKSPDSERPTALGTLSSSSTDLPKLTGASPGGSALLGGGNDREQQSARRGKALHKARHSASAGVFTGGRHLKAAGSSGWPGRWRGRCVRQIAC